MKVLILLKAAEDARRLFGRAVVADRMTRMSWLSTTLRGAGLGGVVDAFDGVENVIKGAAQASPVVDQAINQTVESVGNNASTVVTGVLTKVLPDGAVIAPEVTAPFFAGLEAYVEHFFNNGTTTTPVEGTPPATAPAS